jgi:hypothetical protein
VLRPGAEDPTLLFDAGEPPFGSGALVVGDWLYAYACESPKGSLAVPCLLARVPLDRALDRRAWRYHARGAWVADWRAATSVIDGASLMSVAWNGYLGKFVAVNTRIISSEILVRTADRLEGPWSREIVVEGVPPAVGFPWIASGVGHPELAREGGRIELLTYARLPLSVGSETRAVEIEFRKRWRERHGTDFHGFLRGNSGLLIAQAIHCTCARPRSPLHPCRGNISALLVMYGWRQTSWQPTSA